MTAVAVAFLIASAVAGALALAWGVHLYRVERNAPSQSQRLLGGGR